MNSLSVCFCSTLWSKKSFADCIDASTVAHGYLRSRAGTITTFDAPGAGTGAGQGTFPDQNDPSGGITGYYIDGSGVYHGFLRSK
jgi:hypothetical protein